MFAAAVVLTAYQHDGASTLAASPEEAKQTSEGGSFVPPPRTIGDITAILDQQKLSDPKAAAKARAEASREPPAGARDSTLAKFYWKRGLAAGKIGDVRKQLADLKEAERLSKNVNEKTRMDILWDLGTAENLAGNHADAMRHREESLANVPDNRRGALIGRGAVLAFLYAAGGDMLNAKSRLEMSERLLLDARDWRSWLGNLLRRSYRWGYTAVEAKSETGSTRAAWLFARPRLVLALTPILPFAHAVHIIAAWLRVGSFEPLLMTPMILASRVVYVVGMVVGGLRWLRTRGSSISQPRPSPRWQ